ncbi:MAG TPA: hypothetical protein PKB15_05775 [Acidimicrobiia bacterium]|nr:hypothetical protein [Acidimicrobiia bacterium]
MKTQIANSSSFDFFRDGFTVFPFTPNDDAIDWNAWNKAATESFSSIHERRRLRETYVHETTDKPDAFMAEIFSHRGFTRIGLVYPVIAAHRRGKKDFNELRKTSKTTSPWKTLFDELLGPAEVLHKYFTEVMALDEQDIAEASDPLCESYLSGFLVHTNPGARVNGWRNNDARLHRDLGNRRIAGSQQASRGETPCYAGSDPSKLHFFLQNQVMWFS